MLFVCRRVHFVYRLIYLQIIDLQLINTFNNFARLIFGIKKGVFCYFCPLLLLLFMRILLKLILFLRMFVFNVLICRFISIATWNIAINISIFIFCFLSFYVCCNFPVVAICTLVTIPSLGKCFALPKILIGLARVERASPQRFPGTHFKNVIFGYRDQPRAK